MYNGDLPDNRPQKLKNKDYQARELSATPIYIDRDSALKNAKQYITRNQYQKSSCLPSSCCNALWSTEKKVLADEYLYTQRVNKPSEGSIWYDIADIVINQGTCSRDSMAEVQSEDEANKVVITSLQKADAINYRQKSYLYVDTFDELVSWLNKGFAVPFSIFADVDEWSRSKPVVFDNNLTSEKASINHAICAIPNTGSKDSFFITDSAHFGDIAIREITRAFYNARKKTAIVFMDLEYADGTKPTWYNFTRDLTVGCQGEDVKALQVILQKLGFFPAYQNPTGYFAGLTRQAVKDFQEYYKTDILIAIGLTKGTGYFGSLSRRKLRQLCI